MKAKPVTRLTAKAVFGNVKNLVQKVLVEKAKADDNFEPSNLDGEVVAAARFYGVAKDYSIKKKEWENGDVSESCEFKGDFCGVIVGDDSVQFRSGKMYVPSQVEVMLTSVLDKEDVDEAKFALEIQVIADSTSNFGYMYAVETPLAPEENNAVKELAAAFDS